VTDDDNEAIDAIQRHHRRLRSSRPVTFFLSSVTSFWAPMPSATGQEVSSDASGGMPRRRADGK
jgi:hypothetical protein